MHADWAMVNAGENGTFSLTNLCMQTGQWLILGKMVLLVFTNLCMQTGKT